MDNYHNVLGELNLMLSGFQEQKHQIYQHYQKLVNAVLAGYISSEHDIESIMDGLLDFGDDEQFLELYKTLCRHVYYHYPQLVGEHVNLFRLQFEEKTEE